MKTVDFREVPASPGTHFELFARDFLVARGFEVLHGPAPGPDGGCDLLITEAGSITQERRRWLVTVKHYAHSRRLVGLYREQDALGRLARFDASGLMCFYSTLPSSALEGHLDDLKKKTSVFLYDPAKIAAALIDEPALDSVFRRYFPKSYAALHKINSLRIETEVGRSFPIDDSIPLDLADVLERDEEGTFRLVDRDLEDVITACLLADAFRRNRFDVLSNFTSFRPIVWKHLRSFLKAKGLDGRAIGAAIDQARETAMLRLLISIAGEAGAEEAGAAICRKLISSGPYHSKKVAMWRVPATPFYEVARTALAKLPLGTITTLELFTEEARKLKRWQAKQVFEWAAHKLRRRQEAGEERPRKSRQRSQEAFQ